MRKCRFIMNRKWKLAGYLYLASRVRATIPAARGADAEVPVCRTVQALLTSVVV